MKQIVWYSIFIFTCSLIAQSNKTFEIKNLDINTKYSDFGTTIFGENKIIYASSKRGFGNTSRIWSGNKQPFLDLYEGEIDSKGEISNSNHLTKVINSKFHEGIVAISSDLKTMYFTRDYYYKKKKIKDDDNNVNLAIFVSSLQEDGKWGEPKPFSINDKNYSCGHPTLSSDEKRLYFSSDMPGGYGNTDLYYVEINSDGSYGTPVNLGPKINTVGHEKFPFISHDNTMYFSSDGRKKLGDLDIYQINLDHINNLEPTALEAPINTAFDDFAFVMHPDNTRGYFSSNREGGKGDDDIYSFNLSTPKVACNQKIQGKIVDGANNGSLSGATVVLYDENNKELQTIIVQEDASFTFDIECNKKYLLYASKIGYVKTDAKLESTSENHKIHNIVMSLFKEDFAVVNEKTLIKINPIYFDLNSAKIRKDAEIELAKVVEVMNKYPDIVIECGSHTDVRGNDKYNMWLSERRAQSTIDYIISKGISKERISGKGYGESQILNKCTDGIQCSESQHQLNRRTEFVVIRKE